MRNMLFWTVVVALLFSPLASMSTSSTAASDGIIPADRRIDWSYAGIPGGIPKRTVICRTVSSALYGNGKTDATTVIQNALNNCPRGEIVYLPPGLYLITRTILLHDFVTLRGAGPGITILKHAGSNSLGALVAAQANIYSEIVYQHRVHAILQASKDSQVITLGNTSGIVPGDILLLNQLNDGANVDAVGTNGKCTFCGYEHGDRALGQYVRVTAVTGNQVYINVPLHWTYNTGLQPWAYQVDSNAMARQEGLEDLTVTQDTPSVSYMIEMQGALNSWIRNVEVKNVLNIGIYVIDSLQNEISECYVHNGIAGYGDGGGYGIALTMYSSNNRVEDNILSTIDGGGVATYGGASGNVISYNYFHNIMYHDRNWLIASPVLDHGAYPKMNLWEGNIAYKAEADFIWGSSGYDTIFRSQSKGWNGIATTSNIAISISKKGYYMNVVGSVLGTPGKSNRYEVLPGQPYDQVAERVIWALGADVGGSPTDPHVAATLLRHGNFDYVTNSVIWDPTIPDHDLPASLYLSQGPDWWCQETPWPPIGPDVVGLVNKIPAERRFEGLPCHPKNALSLTLVANPVDDGWVLESGEFTNAGGTKNSIGTRLIVGDDAKNRQYRSILEFATGQLPDNAMIYSIAIKVKKGLLTAADLFTQLSGLTVDIKKPSFGLPELELTDFQAPAGTTGAASVGAFGPIPDGNGWYIANLSVVRAAPFLNKWAPTQFRLRFNKDDNNNLRADYLSVYSGNAAAGNRPVLIVIYTVP